MKTLTAPLQQYRKLKSDSRESWLGFAVTPMRNVLTLAVAVLTAAVVITLAVWSAGMGANPVLGVATWGLGFIFLGLAVDSQGLPALLRTATGVALLVLAVLQAQLSANLIIVSGVLLAAWAGFIVLKLFLLQENH